MAFYDDLADFETTEFNHRDVARAVFRLGSGPAVIVMAEMPGITPTVADFARRVADLGCTAVMPHLFGEPGRAGIKSGRPDMAYVLKSMVPACLSRDFSAFATDRTAPVIGWLRALSRYEVERCGGGAAGAVGMCFTGGFALGMMVDDHLVAPVLSQPSLPIGPTAKRKSAVHLSHADLERIKERCAEGVSVLGLRFTGDWVSPAERFASLRRELGDGFNGIEIDSSPGNPWGIRKAAHSVLTEDLVDEPGHPTHEALLQVLEFLSQRLLPSGRPLTPG